MSSARSYSLLSRSALCSLRPSPPERQRECRSNAELGLDLDAAAEQLGEPLRDVETEPGAAVPAREAGVDLRERPEQSTRVLRRDADPGVHDGEAHLATLLALSLA